MSIEHGEWDKMTKREMWETIQEIRELVGSDGTRSIISDIEAYAERYSKHQHEMAMLFAKLTRAATDFIDQNGCKPEWWTAELSQMAKNWSKEC